MKTRFLRTCPSLLPASRLPLAGCLLLAGCLPLAGCGAQATVTEPAPAPAPAVGTSTWMVYESARPQATANQLAPGEGGMPELAVSGTFTAYHPGNAAVTYDQSLVPIGARARLAITMTSYGTVIRLTAAGLVPRHAYGAHLHTMPCTGMSDQAGPHYQHHHDPKTPSVNPAYANPSNEVWLDFTAAPDGTATAVSQENWTLDPKDPPKSLVIHASPTRTGKGKAGTAGARVACLTVPTGS